MLTYTVPTDEEIRAEAEALYNPEYETNVNSLNQQATTYTTLYERSLADYQDYIAKTLEDTQLSIENSLLKRGMGRSSRAAYEVTTGLADVNQEGQDYLAELAADYQTNMAGIDTQLATLASTKEQNIAAAMLDLKQYYEGIREFEAQLAASSSGSSGSSNSSLFDLIDLTGNVSSNYTGVQNGNYYVNGKEVSSSAYKLYTNYGKTAGSGSYPGQYAYNQSLDKFVNGI